MLHIGLISKNKNIELIRELSLYEDVQAFNIKEEEDFRNNKIDIMVLEDLIISKDILENQINDIKYLIIQDNISDIQFNLDKEINIITFGFNHKSTVTVSSVTEENIVICIQRMIKTINNNEIQSQEKIIKNNNKYKINKYIIKKIIEEILEK